MEDENFRDKYTKSGMIGRFLVNRFFSQFSELIEQCGTDITTVLEIGAGEGFSTQRIANLLGSGVRLEASEYRGDLVSRAAARNPGVNVRQESIYSLDRPDHAFDILICLEVLEHLENPQAALQELARVSKKYVVISVPREPIWRILNMARGKYLGSLGNTPGHIQHWSSRGLRDFVSPRFRIVDMRKPLPWTILLLKPA
ncbi:methyltransferase type 11 [Sulfuricaulis limicola]|uniref:Methyltransferase type 11 n=1 Tax=Sulfuricaulis limicola TaxID=1620215 RepID=A0A1B4XEI6_9GAMM|nr:class I SAM-dependent methyltransferase [Sulfuricaulis limicola]BAV33222.1 methyltransferase type 11 [Sulfuricaulis limicola]